MTDRQPIIGFGGGKSGGGETGGRTAVESPDSLRSRQYARVIDMLSEGEIGGLVAGMKSVYLDDTPIQNADDTYNFSGVALETRTGTQSQVYISGFSAVENEVAVSTEVTNASSVTRSVTNASIDAVRITLSIPRLTYQDPSNGDLGGTSVDIAIDVQNNGGGFVEVKADTVSGKTTGRYQRAYRVELPAGGPWDIRVRRITADSTASNLQNQTWWSSYTEIIDAKLRYPNSALCALQIDSEQFSAVPRRGYDIYGIKVKIPINYNPTTRAYDGVWDGTFMVAWTDNPAWIFYDLVTSERYGLGKYIDPTLVDKWGLYDIGRYCDELVDDGFGGHEPRFTCNVFLQRRDDAYRTILSLASVFRGIAFWGTGAITASADKPEDPTMLFTNANVIDGAFSYSGSDRAARHTVALVTWNDPADQCRQKIEYVEDDDGIQIYGVVETEVQAVGCASRGQARRLGRWILNTEINETDTVTFRCGLDGIYVYPGAVITTQDRNRSTLRFGGRIVSAAVDEVTIDAPVTIETGKAYTLSCVLPDGTVESRPVTNAAGSTTILAPASDFSAAPQEWAIWVLAASDLAAESWRVVSVKEVESHILEITGLTYRVEKYDAVETGLVLQAATGSSLTAMPLAPTNVEISESLYQSGTDVKAQVVVSWDSVPGLYWDVSWKVNEGNWAQVTRLAVPTATIPEMLPGFIEVRVVAVTTLGLRSPSSYASKVILGKTAPPADVSLFNITKVGGLGVAEWGMHPDLDVRVGGRIVIRHSPLTTGAVWSNSVIVAIFTGSTTTGNLALMSGTYMAKARDSTGNWSGDEVAFVATEGMASAYTTVTSSVQHPSFSGTKTDTEIDGTNLQIAGTASTGTYDFSAVIDLTTVATRRFEADVGVLGFDTGDTIDERTTYLDDWGDFDGAVINDSDATLYISVTDDDPAGSPAWGPWVPFFVADFTCRAARFQLMLERATATNNIAVDTLRVDVKIPT
jgi:predicted phage tail protein